MIACCSVSTLRRALALAAARSPALAAAWAPAALARLLCFSTSASSFSMRRAVSSPSRCLFASHSHDSSSSAFNLAFSAAACSSSAWVWARVTTTAFLRLSLCLLVELLLERPHRTPSSPPSHDDAKPLLLGLGCLVLDPKPFGNTASSGGRIDFVHIILDHKAIGPRC